MKRALADFVFGIQDDRIGITKSVNLTKSVIFALTKFVQTNAPLGHFGIGWGKVKRGVHFVRL